MTILLSKPFSFKYFSESAKPRGHCKLSENCFGSRAEVQQVSNGEGQSPLLFFFSWLNPSLGHTSARVLNRELTKKMENNPKEQAEQQRVNFNGDPHIHDNGNVFHHFQPTPAVDSGYALNHSMARPLRKRPWHHSNNGTSPGTTNFLSLLFFLKLK